VFVEGHGIAFELFGVPGHGGRLPFFQPDWAGYQVSTKQGSGPGQPALYDNGIDTEYTHSIGIQKGHI
ncbi:hypothetical protein ACUY22_12795, partial [Corynebacterium tuberculostearicum]